MSVIIFLIVIVTQGKKGPLLRAKEVTLLTKIDSLPPKVHYLGTEVPLCRLV